LGIEELNIFRNRRKIETKAVQVDPQRYRCDSCGKIFATPLKMLDFKCDPPKEVEICPFCDGVLTK